MEHKGVLLSGLGNHMDQLETPHTLRLHQRESQDHMTNQLVHGLCHGVNRLLQPLYCMPYLVCHVLDLNILPFRVYVDDLYIASGSGGDVGFIDCLLLNLRSGPHRRRGAGLRSWPLAQLDVQPVQERRYGMRENNIKPSHTLGVTESTFTRQKTTTTNRTNEDNQELSASSHQHPPVLLCVEQQAVSLQLLI